MLTEQQGNEMPIIESPSTLAEIHSELSQLRKIVEELLANQLDQFKRSLGVHMPFYTSDWVSWQAAQHWNLILKDIKGKPNLRFMEIGSFQGRSANWFVENVLTHPTSRLDCVDNFFHLATPRIRNGLKETFFYNIEPNLHKISAHLCTSEKVGELFQPDTFDVIYVDGSHYADHVYRDLVLCMPLLKTGGIMLIDDYGWSDPLYTKEQLPKAGIDRFLNEFENQIEILHKDYQVSFRKL
jgi:predicted O-methyltransferase YrrM